MNKIRHKSSYPDHHHVVCSDSWYTAGRGWHNVLKEVLLDGWLDNGVIGSHRVKVIGGVSTEVSAQATQLALVQWPRLCIHTTQTRFSIMHWTLTFTLHKVDVNF